MFWTVLLIHYHADNLDANVTAKVAYSTYSKSAAKRCSRC
jgi:hypothetical protein